MVGKARYSAWRRYRKREAHMLRDRGNLWGLEGDQMSGVTICAKCETANPPEARFCMSCGAGLERACPQCGAPAPPGARFCMTCGASLESPAATPPATEVPTPVVAAEERRTVT